MSFELPKLPYAYGALEPHIDARTMEIHHSKHHNGYTNNLNNAIAGTDLEGKSIEEICANPGLSGAARNNGGGYYNHCMFWESMNPNGGGTPIGNLASAVDSAFESFDNFKAEFSKSAGTRFGSGWAWLAIDNGKLVVTKSANASNPLVEGMKPILGCDVWEHSYYIDYRNKRPDYLKAFLDNLINWEFVSSQLD